MNSKLYRLKNNFIFQTGKFLSFYKVYLFVFFIIFLISFITGIMTCSHYSSIVTYENLINKYLIKFFTREYKFTTYFLILLAYLVVIALFIMIFTKNIFVVIVDGILFSFMAYIFGFDLCIVILSFGVAGVFFGVLFLGIPGFLIFFLLMLFLSIATKRYFIKKKSTDCLPNNYYIKVFLFLILLALIVLFLHSLLFSIIHIFVIVE